MQAACESWKRQGNGLITKPSEGSRSSHYIDFRILTSRIRIYLFWTSLVAQIVKNLAAIWETWVRSLGWEDHLEKGMETHFSVLAGRIPLDRGAWRLQSKGSQRVGHE